VTTIDGDPVGGAVFEVRVRGGRVIGGQGRLRRLDIRL
jgi:hypothetical protein